MAIFKNFSPNTAILLLLSKVTQKHFRQPYRPSKVPLRPAGGYSSRCSAFFYITILTDLFRYSCLHIFQISTVRRSNQIPFSCRDSSPFLSVPTYHQPELPDLLRSEILYQSINPMLISHICHCCCYILIFPVSSYLSAPFTICKRNLL